MFELLREYCLTNRVKLSFITLTLQYDNDMIIFLIHLKKKLFKGLGGAMETPDLTTEMPKKQTHKT